MAKKLASFRVRCFSVPKLAESLSEDPAQWPMLGLNLKARQERAILWAGGDWARRMMARLPSARVNLKDSRSPKL